MKTVIRSDTVNLDEYNYPVLSSSCSQESYLDVLKCIKSQMDAMLSHHSKILVFRIDLHLHDFEKNNTTISKFIRKLRKKLVNKYKLKRMGYVWVREQERAKAQHYHLALMLDANKVQHPKRVITLIETIWIGWDQPKPYTPKNCFYIVRRGDAAAYDSTFKRLSYLAKTRGKGYRDRAVNDYSSSRINPAVINRKLSDG